MNTYRVFLSSEHSVDLEADLVYCSSTYLSFRNSKNNVNPEQAQQQQLDVVAVFNFENILGYELIENFIEKSK